MPSRLESRGAVSVLLLDEPRGNALGTETLARVNALLDEVERADPAALVITGRDKIFSVGLDLIEASALARPALAAYVDLFESFFLRLFTFPVPMVAAINGHAMAGGAVIALCCDLRVAQDAPLAISLNEVELGMPFPSVAREVCRFGLPPLTHSEAIALARRYSVAEARDAGFVHEIAMDARNGAMARATEIAKLGKQAVRAVRRDLRAEFVARAQADAVRSRAAFVDAWLGDEAAPRIRAVVAGLKRS